MARTKKEHIRCFEILIEEKRIEIKASELKIESLGMEIAHIERLIVEDLKDWGKKAEQVKIEWDGGQ